MINILDHFHDFKFSRFLVDFCLNSFQSHEIDAKPCVYLLINRSKDIKSRRTNSSVLQVSEIIKCCNSQPLTHYFLTTLVLMTSHSSMTSKLKLWSSYSPPMRKYNHQYEYLHCSSPLCDSAWVSFRRQMNSGAV